MAAETGIPSVYLEQQLLHGRAAKKTQESVIEKLRHKVSQPHSWSDSIKSVKSFVAERRTQTEKAETSCVQQCLDTLQKAMKVTSHQTLKERLDLIGRQLGLNVEIEDLKVLLITDTFQVEVLLGDGGTIANVKLANQGDVVDCPDLRDILTKGDFTEFIEHLQGLQSIYQVTSDEKLKSKAYLALQALEQDLDQLAQFQSSICGVANYVHKSPLGIMLPRISGKPMKLIYFVSPYDLLDKKTLTAHPLSVDAIRDFSLGQSVNVCIEAVPDNSPANKLQTMPLMSVSKTQDGKSLPSFSAVSKNNSMMLPAYFVLVLRSSVPMSVQIMQKITSQTGLEIHQEVEPRSMCSLVLESFSGGKIADCTQLFVSLPDQQHIYFLDGVAGRSPDQFGVMVSRIPFTHPTHVPHILNILRQQLLFNIVLSSCIRPGAKKDPANCFVFEVTAVSLQQLTIVFEHPAYDSMTTVDVDLSDITNLKCRVSCPNSDKALCSDEAISKVFQRCMSLPVMLRWLIGKGCGHLDKLKEAADKERVEKALFLKEMQHRQAKLQPTTLPANRPPPQPPHPPPLPPPPSYSHSRHSPMHFPPGQLVGSGTSQTTHPITVEARGTLEEFRHMAESNSKLPNERLLKSIDDEQADNPLLSNLLDEEKLSGAGSQTDMHDSPMLSRLLDDNTSVATTVIPMNCKLTPSASFKRQRKRKLPSDLSGPSPKHRVNDIDSTDRLSLLGSPMELDMGPAFMDQSLPNTPTIMGSSTPTHGSPSYHHHHPMLNHVAKATRPQSNVIDLTEVNLVGESSLKKLADSVDKHFIHKDVKTEPDLSMLLNEAESPNRIPNILQNSPSGSKNENASTSLEGFLKGSGEVGRAKDFDPSDASSVHGSVTLSKLSSLLLTSSDSPSPNFGISSYKSNSPFFSDKLGREDTFGTGVGKIVSDGAFPPDIKPSSASLRKGTLRQSSSVDIPNDKQVNSGIFEKFDIPRQHQNVKTEAANSETKPQVVEGKVSLKLRVERFKQNSVKPYVKSFNSVDEADLDYVRSNSIGRFDFKSDEDDDDLLLQLPSDRFVYSSSPTCVQISSNKQKRLNDYVSIPHKSDKAKKKDRNAGNLTKRKREKDEAKREKKRKKTEHIIDESVYRTVENDTKDDFKLKIRVAKKPVTDKSDFLSDGKVPSYEIKKRSLSGSLDKPLEYKQDEKDFDSVVSQNVKEKETVIEGSGTSKTAISKLTTNVNKSTSKSGCSKPVQGGGSSNKTDPKLVTKATIRLKPLTMPNSGSTVNISQSGPKSSNTSSCGNKTDRRISTSASAALSDKRSTGHNALLERRSSMSNLVDRRSVTQSSSQLLTSSTSSLSSSGTTTAAVTPTTASPANLSLSSILPNAPTISKIASLPRIPKLSSSSSNTSINRTSSLDPVSGSIPTSAGTKSNNSYTVGPAGRPNQAAISGPGISRSSTGTFSYNRPTTPGGSGSSRPNFSASRSFGPTQTSPVISGQGVSRQSGPRAHNLPASGSSHKAAVNPANSHRPSGNFTANPVKGTTGSSISPNVSQKTHTSGAKINNSISVKMSNNSTGQKSITNSNNVVSGQRHVTQNSSLGNSMRVSGSSSGVCRSPNTTGISKSPNSGKSPNITNSGKSPNITNSGKSPNITNSGRSPSLNSASKSPNISAANRSPNSSSSISGRSPSINSNKSPNVTNSSVKPSSSTSHSSKLSASTSHRYSSSLTKPSVGNKSTTVKSHSSSPSHRSLNSISASNKSSTTKPGTKATSSSVSQLPGNCKSIVVDAVHSVVNNKIPSGANSTGSLSSQLSSEPLSNLSAQKMSSEQQITSSVVLSVTASSSPSSPPLPALPLSPTKSNSCDHVESQENKGSKDHPSDTSKTSVVSEKCPVSTSGTSQSVDSTKSTFSFPSCRGRKNSLSAIVDKLKHNAVGSVLDPPEMLTTSSDDSNSVTTKASLNSELKSDIMPASVDAEDRTSSPHTDKSVSNSDRVGRKQNHFVDDNHIKAVCENSSDGERSNSFSFSSVKCLQSEISDILFSVVSCDQSRHVEDRSQDFTCLSDGHDLAGLKDGSVSDREKSLLDIPEGNNIIEKPTTVMVPLPLQSVVSSPSESSAINSCDTSITPQTSSFQSLNSPSLTKCASSLTAPTDSNCKSEKDSMEQLFKMPSVNIADYDEPKSSEMPELNSKSQSDNVDVNVANVANDNHERSNDDNQLGSSEKEARGLEKESKSLEKGSEHSEKDLSPSKPLSSPLSDISSPENGLIINDDESLHLSSKSSTGNAISFNSGAKPHPSKSSMEDSSRTISQPSEDASVNSPNIPECTSNAASPRASWPSFVQSPTLSKSSSGASFAKESDSPCPIDDDLMDVALGVGN